MIPYRACLTGMSRREQAHLPRVVMCSMWKDDCNRRIVDRVEHLLAKAETYPALRFVWVVGDSTDDTTRALANLSMGYDNARIVDIGDTGIVGSGMATRLRRLSETGNEWWNWCDGGFDGYVMIHESDILSPPDVVNQLVAHAERGRCPIAGWPTIKLRGEQGVAYFYDTWAYRKDGVRFENDVPYHACYRYPEPFTVDSFGTMYMFHAEDVPLVRFENNAVLDLCRQLREQGRDLWVDPTLKVEQPRDLWTFYNAP